MFAIDIYRDGKWVRIGMTSFGTIVQTYTEHYESIGQPYRVLYDGELYKEGGIGHGKKDQQEIAS